MKKEKLTIIATIIAILVISLFAFQPTITEASSNISPTATPNPRKIRKLPKQSIEVENDETHITRKPITKVKAKKPGVREGGINDTTFRSRKRNGAPKKPAGFQEVSGIGMEVTLRKNKSTTQAQYNPKELQIDQVVNRKSNKNKTSIETRNAKQRLMRRKN